MSSKEALDELVAQLRDARPPRTQRELALALCIAETSFQDWEYRRDSPTTPHLILWAYEVGLRLWVEGAVDRTFPDGVSYEDREFALMATALRGARQRLGLARELLATYLGVTLSTVGRRERGNTPPRPVDFLTWAATVGCRVVLRPLKEESSAVE